MIPAGYGLVYALDFAMRDLKDKIAGKKITISGSGNVALFAAEKCLELGGIVLTFSDSSGTIFEVRDFNRSVSSASSDHPLLKQ